MASVCSPPTTSATMPLLPVIYQRNYHFSSHISLTLNWRSLRQWHTLLLSHKLSRNSLNITSSCHLFCKEYPKSEPILLSFLPFLICFIPGHFLASPYLGIYILWLSALRVETSNGVGLNWESPHFWDCYFKVKQWDPHCFLSFWDCGRCAENQWVLYVYRGTCCSFSREALSGSTQRERVQAMEVV